MRRELHRVAGLTPTGRDSSEWKQHAAAIEDERVELERFLVALDDLAEREAALRSARDRVAELTRQAADERRAVEFDRHARALCALELREQATATIDELERFERNDLQTWHELDGQRNEARAELKAIRGSLERLGSDLERAEGELRKHSASLEDAERRNASVVGSGIVARNERVLRDLETADAGRARRHGLTWVAAACSIATLVLMSFGLIERQFVIVGSASLLAAVSGWLWNVVLGGRARAEAARREARSIVEDAGSLGIATESVTEIRKELDAIAARCTQAAEAVSARREALELLHAGRRRERERERDADAKLERLETELGALRARTRVASAEALRTCLARRDTAHSRRTDAEAELAALFPDCAPDRWAATIEATQLEDPGLRPTAGRLDRTERDLERSRERIESLTRETDGWIREQLSRLGVTSLDRARERLTQILAEQASRLRDRAAVELVREAIDGAERDVDGHLDRVLRDTDGGADGLFEQLTRGQFKSIRRDADGFCALRPDGSALPIAALSRGTIDQLHFTLRAALAERVLGTPCFFVWDDTFLTADPERRRALVSAATALARRGWQILYLTVDPTIADLFEAETARHETLTLRQVTLPAYHGSAAPVDRG